MAQSKSLNTLVPDIMALFDPDTPHEACEENLEEFAKAFKETLRTRLQARETNTNLRFSMLGQPDRKIWYTANGYEQEKMTSKTYMKFMYGDVIELLVLFLAKEAGHSVEMMQGEVEVDGVKGHIDAIIDGVVVDVKSASPFSYRKFEDNKVLDDDPFGYVQQLSGYAQVLTPGEAAAWVAFDKVSGDICVTPLSSSVIGSEEYDVAKRIEHLRGLIALPLPPEKCYQDVEDGKSGNRKLSVGCSYCGHKFRCWPGLRTFLYSGAGPRFLTQVARVPDVPEVR